MPFIETDFRGVLIFEPKLLGDDRGYFFESYNQNTFKEAGITANFVQDNQARSRRGVLRGLHYQVAPEEQAKLVRVIDGEVLDVIVDLRPDEPTYGKWMSIRLSAANKRQLYIPKGFAHGYTALTPEAEFFYKCDSFYSRDHEAGLLYNDPVLNIDWEVDLNQVTTSEKDKGWPVFGQHRTA